MTNGDSDPRRVNDALDLAMRSVPPYAHVTYLAHRLNMRADALVDVRWRPILGATATVRRATYLCPNYDCHGTTVPVQHVMLPETMRRLPSADPAVKAYIVGRCWRCGTVHWAGVV